MELKDSTELQNSFKVKKTTEQTYGFLGHLSHPQDSKSLTEGPATQEVYLKTVIENNDCIFISIQGITLWVCVERAFCPRPPLEGSYHL